MCQVSQAIGGLGGASISSALKSLIASRTI